ncbi:helix-turn-helix domain-containing protein [Paenibacillus sp.]|uniref:TetR/AcrR family transcriptional regulator n=1 Tax=Paenibacillus sp. TaxID=58172 RepID=UPI002D605B22|nr:helix-turn-helix domain-containing protein [Paenibacillus sp.]HZG57703.1 helix-turn-helix domain-containing protein [Paenibacillus sp.]
MNDKKEQIIETALRLFAAKGFHATSIQDIAEAIGIAKGSVYIHFKSKEDMLVSALKHTVQRMIEDVGRAAAAPGLSPRERLVRKTAEQLRFATEHKSFFLMLMNEGMLHVNEELKSFMLELRIRGFRWAQADIQDVYGERVGPYALDAVAVLQALCAQYTGYLLIEQAEIDIEALAAFLADRLDDAVDGMIRKGLPPILTERTLAGTSLGTEAGDPVGPIDLRAQWLRVLREAIRESVRDDAKREELLGYTVVLEAELRKRAPSDPIVLGVLEHLREAEPAMIGQLVRQLEKAIVQ